ncbi:MAG: hypothetical protein JXR37_07050 [Kiritimatiellae bacterium]|nr:hypothetical protein [Kiritimatiellia bacterium]
MRASGTVWAAVALCVAFGLPLTAGSKVVLSAAERTEQAQRHIVSPRFWDPYHGRKDRLYLDGVWKLNLENNVLTESFMAANMQTVGWGKHKDLHSGQTLQKDVEIRYSAFADDSGLRKRFYDPACDDAAWPDILVPSNWSEAMPWEEKGDSRPHAVAYRSHGQTRGYYVGGIGYYRRRFTLPAAKRGKRWFLHFTRVDVIARVWVNGQLLTPADHVNLTADPNGMGQWLNAFEVEVPDRALNFGERENVLTVRVFAKGVPFPYGQPNKGGIQGPVWLECREPVFAGRILTAADYRTDSLRVRFDLDGARESRGRLVVEPWASEDYVFPGPGKRFEVPYTVAAGTFDRRIPLPGIAYWSPASPCLYALRIVDEENRTLGITRFGMATLEARNAKFYLNGNHIFLAGMQMGGSLCGHPLNADNRGRDLLRLRRGVGFNFYRVHTGPYAPWDYALCDEEGFVVADEWGRGGDTYIDAKDPEREAEYQMRVNYGRYFAPDGAMHARYVTYLKKWMDESNPHPCVLLVSGGNEAPGACPYFQKWVRAWSALKTDYDIRNRLLTPNSGTHWTRHNEEKRELRDGEAATLCPADYVDFHDYSPDGRTTILDTRHHHLYRAEEVYKLYGRRDIPLLNNETVLGGGWGGITPLAAEYDWRVKGNKLAVVRYLKQKKAPQGVHHRTYHDHNLWAVAFGVRALIDLETASCERSLWLKKYIEHVRYNVPEVQGYGFHTGDGWMQAYKGNKRVSAYGHPGTNDVANAQQPVQVMVRGLHEVSVFAGEETDQDLVLVNNTGDAWPEAAVAVSVGGERLADVRLGAIAPEQIKPFSARLTIPSRCGTGRHRLVLALTAAGRLVAENAYDLLTVVRQNPLGDGARAYVLDGPSGGAAQAAQRLGFAAVPFDGGRAARLTIVGPGAFPAPDSPAFAKLDAWLRAGGRLLALEQPPGTPNPWLGQKVKTDIAQHMGSPLVPDQHVLLRDLHFRNYGYWRKGAVYNSFFPSVTGDVLVLGNGGSMRPWAGQYCWFGAVAVGQRVGSGRYVWTQQKLADNIAVDAAAWCVARNLVLHLMDSDGGEWRTADASPAQER